MDLNGPDTPVPPHVRLPTHPAETVVRDAVSALDPSRRLGALHEPVFLSLSTGAESTPRLLYLGLTAASESWLRKLAGDDFARERRDEIRESFLDLGVGRVPDDPVGQVVAGVTALRDSLPRVTLTLAVMPLGLDGGSGLAYSRDPLTGRRGLNGLFAPKRTGADLLTRGGDDLRVVAATEEWGARLEEILAVAEERAGHPVRAEFVVERGRLWVMSVRRAHLRGAALVLSTVSAARQGRIGDREALAAVTGAELAAALVPNAETSGLKVAARGLGVSPGVADGIAAFSSAEAVALAERGIPAVLILPESRPQELPGLLAASAVVTERGGRTSHAGVIARNLGRPCVTALNEASVDVEGVRLRLMDGRSIAAGDEMTVDGSSGAVYLGRLTQDQDPSARPAEGSDLGEAIGWLLDRTKDVQGGVAVRVNADSAEDSIRGREAGALGVGLCRIEHMFLGERHALLQRALLASRGPDAAEALATLRRTLQADFTAILESMDGLPVVVRLLDPPRHEFLPDTTELEIQAALSDARGESASRPELLPLVRRLREHNPMMGVRGVRLGLLTPEVTAAQIQALVASAVALRRRGGDPRPELLVPMVSVPSEVTAIRKLLGGVCAEMGLADEAKTIPLGAMIETPRAALLARELARRADFLSIGTNDLTSLVWGLSRDDAELHLLPAYEEMGLLEESPFERLDLGAVGSLVSRVVTDARDVNPSIPIGVCGEHAAEEDAIRAFASFGVDYVSCAARRVPAARLASARGVIVGSDAARAGV